MRSRHPGWIAALLAVATFVVGCGSSNVAPDLGVSPEGDVILTEVRFGEYVVLTNTRDAVVDLADHWLGNGPAHLELAGDLEPGESVRIAAEPLGGLSAGGGEVALFRAPELTAPRAIVDYVTWGAGGGGTPVAVQAGVWPTGGTVEVTGPSIWRTLLSGGPEAWFSAE